MKETVDVNLSNVGPSKDGGIIYSFGCDETTEKNILSAKTSSKDTIKWAPKGETTMFDLTKAEAAELGDKILDVKTAFHEKYFLHKKAIMDANTYTAVMNHDIGANWD